MTAAAPAPQSCPHCAEMAEQLAAYQAQVEQDWLTAARLGLPVPRPAPAAARRGTRHLTVVRDTP